MDLFKDPTPKKKGGGTEKLSKPYKYFKEQDLLESQKLF